MDDWTGNEEEGSEDEEEIRKGIYDSDASRISLTFL